MCTFGVLGLSCETPREREKKRSKVGAGEKKRNFGRSGGGGSGGGGLGGGRSGGGRSGSGVWERGVLRRGVRRTLACTTGEEVQNLVVLSLILSTVCTHIHGLTRVAKTTSTWRLSALPTAHSHC